MWRGIAIPRFNRALHPALGLENSLLLNSTCFWSKAKAPDGSVGKDRSVTGAFGKSAVNFSGSLKHVPGGDPDTYNRMVARIPMYHILWTLQKMPWAKMAWAKMATDMLYLHFRIKLVNFSFDSETAWKFKKHVLIALWSSWWQETPPLPEQVSSECKASCVEFCWGLVSAHKQG